MPNEGGIVWLLNKLTKGVVLLFVLVVVVASFIPLFRQSQRLSDEKDKLEHQIKVVEAENKHLEAEALGLSRDPHYVERVAREKMGWAKPDEKVYRFEQPKGR